MSKLLATAAPAYVVADRDGPTRRVRDLPTRAPWQSAARPERWAAPEPDAPTEVQHVQAEDRREPVYFARDPDEWQGMRVDLTDPMDCDRSDGCNIAMACIARKCGACTADVQCPEGEVCAMDHCIPAKNRQCRARSDCAEGELCFLTSFSGTSPRLNENMLSYCAPTSGENTYAKGPVLVNEHDAPEPDPVSLGPAYEMAADVLEHSQALQRGQRSRELME